MKTTPRAAVLSTAALFSMLYAVAAAAEGNQGRGTESSCRELKDFPCALGSLTLSPVRAPTWYGRAAFTFLPPLPPCHQQQTILEGSVKSFISVPSLLSYINEVCCEQESGDNVDDGCCHRLKNVRHQDEKIGCVIF